MALMMESMKPTGSKLTGSLPGALQGWIAPLASATLHILALISLLPQRPAALAPRVELARFAVSLQPAPPPSLQPAVEPAVEPIVEEATLPPPPEPAPIPPPPKEARKPAPVRPPSAKPSPSSPAAKTAALLPPPPMPAETGPEPAQQEPVAAPVAAPAEADCKPGQEVALDYVEKPAPRYPGLLRERGIGGTVLLRVQVEEDGRAGQVLLHKSSGYRLLDESALRTVGSSWRFKPDRCHHQPRGWWAEVPIRFDPQNG